MSSPCLAGHCPTATPRVSGWCSSKPMPAACRWWPGRRGWHHRSGHRWRNRADRRWHLPDIAGAIIRLLTHPDLARGNMAKPVGADRKSGIGRRSPNVFFRPAASRRRRSICSPIPSSRRPCPWPPRPPPKRQQPRQHSPRAIAGHRRCRGGIRLVVIFARRLPDQRLGRADRLSGRLPGLGGAADLSDDLSDFAKPRLLPIFPPAAGGRDCRDGHPSACLGDSPFLGTYQCFQ